MLLESIDKRVRGTEALTHVLGSRPLVVIPYLPVLEDGVRRKRMFRLAIISAIVAMIVTVVAIHYLYLPLDILFVKILAKLM